MSDMFSSFCARCNGHTVKHIKARTVVNKKKNYSENEEYYEFFSKSGSKDSGIIVLVFMIGNREIPDNIPKSLNSCVLHDRDSGKGMPYIQSILSSN